DLFGFFVIVGSVDFTIPPVDTIVKRLDGTAINLQSTAGHNCSAVEVRGLSFRLRCGAVHARARVAFNIALCFIMFGDHVITESLERIGGVPDGRSVPFDRRGRRIMPLELWPAG